MQKLQGSLGPQKKKQLGKFYKTAFSPIVSGTVSYQALIATEGAVKSPVALSKYSEGS